MLLQSVLVGKAREIYIQLDAEQAANYDNVIELILRGYELVPEAYRQKFRSFEYDRGKDYSPYQQSKSLLAEL